MKALIPVAGAGTKLRPHTHTQPKPLIPVAGKPIIAHIIDNLIKAGVTEQVFVVGYMGEKIQDYILSTYQDKIQAEFIVQTPRHGLAHAVHLSKQAFAEQEEMLILLGDTIFGYDTIAEIRAQERSSFAVQEVDSPADFGVAILDEDGLVEQLQEKPEIPLSNLAMVGLYKLLHLDRLWKALARLIPAEIDANTGAEYSLTDALIDMIEQGERFGVLPVDHWFDCGKKSTLIQTNRVLLDQRAQKGTLAEPAAPYENTVIIPPVDIAEGCSIKNSIIGPFVTVAEHTRIRNSIVRNSILGAYAQLETIILDNSVIGNDATLRGKANQISIGDNTEIDFDQ